MWKLFLLILYLASLNELFCRKVELIRNTRPVVGIVAQETDEKIKKFFPDYSSFIAASYVKAIEGSGARVMPIPIKRDENFYNKHLRSLSGILFPGGSSTRGMEHPYYKTCSQIIKIVKKINDEGVTLPLFGVGLGMEFLLELLDDKFQDLFEKCNVHNKYLPLHLMNISKEDVHLYRDFSNNTKYILSNENVTLYSHTLCLTYSKFLENYTLKDSWTVTAISTYKDYNFVATIEHKTYPFYGIHFQPEKVIYEWTTSSQTSETLQTNRAFYDAFVMDSRYSEQHTDNFDEEYQTLIYNFQPTFTFEKLDEYAQIYFDPFPSGKGVKNINSCILLFVLLTACQILY